MRRKHIKNWDALTEYERTMACSIALCNLRKGQKSEAEIIAILQKSNFSQDSAEHAIGDMVQYLNLTKGWKTKPDWIELYSA